MLYKHFTHACRKPTKTYSQYQMGVRSGVFKKGSRTLSFAEMLEEERKEERKHPTQYRFLSRSIYIKHLRHWMKWFPKKQFLILKSEDLFEKPSIIFRQVTRFLDLSNWEPKNYRNENKQVMQANGIQTDYPDMPVHLRQRLSQYFKPYNQQLYKLIGRNLGWEDKIQ